MKAQYSVAKVIRVIQLVSDPQNYDAATILSSEIISNYLYLFIFAFVNKRSNTVP